MRFIHRKIKASVLQFALLVATLVALLLLSFITLTHTQQFFKIQSGFFLNTISQSTRGVLSILNEGTASTITAIDENVTIDKSFWGGFEKVTAIANHNNISIKTVALTGKKTNKQKVALYLEDKINPLVVVGNTHIEGVVYIPKNGVKAGSIAGTYYSGSQVIYGPIYYSESELPKLTSGFKQHVNDILNGKKIEGLTLMERVPLIKNSFKEPAKVILVDGLATINETATGNIYFYSNKEITVSSDAILTDVTLVAPIVRVEKGFEGRVHIVASDSIIISENVNLRYPSSLVVSEKIDQLPDFNPAIIIEKDSNIEGVVMHLKQREAERPDTNIHLFEDATIKGDVYCEGFFELNGTVEGSVYVHKFITKTSGGRYLNHILGGKIVSDRKSDDFCGFSLEEHPKGIVQWLY